MEPEMKILRILIRILRFILVCNWTRRRRIVNLKKYTTNVPVVVAECLPSFSFFEDFCPANCARLTETSDNQLFLGRPTFTLARQTVSKNEYT